MIEQKLMEIHQRLCSAVVCFGDSDWWYHNHGHMDMQLMRRFARLTKVLYVNSIVVRKFNVCEGGMFFRRLIRKLRSIGRGLRPSGIDNMMVYSPLSLPVHHVPVARYLNQKIIQMQIIRRMQNLDLHKPLIWVTCPGAAAVAAAMKRTKLVYQRSDCYEELPGIDGEQVKKYDRLLKEHADLVIYVSKELMEREKAQCGKTMFLDHGVDFELFAGAISNPYIPQQMQVIPHSVLGFYGGIDKHTVDISLVEKVADLLQDFSIVLIGSSSVDLSSLASRKNVYLLGQKPYDQIPHYAKCFDVCFMPWQQNKWIQACNPVKLKEYLALGKPVVSTPFKELDSYNGLVTVVSDAESFAEAARDCLRQNCVELVLKRQRRVSNCSWEAKTHQVLRALWQTD